MMQGDRDKGMYNSHIWQKTYILIAVEAKLKISSMAREIDFLQACLKQKEGNYCHNKIKVFTVTL